MILREQRLKRAFDLSAKRKLLPSELQKENPYDVKIIELFINYNYIIFFIKLYLHQRVRLAQFERQERDVLNG